jgi:hypothetical protein
MLSFAGHQDMEISIPQAQKIGRNIKDLRLSELLLPDST